MGTSFGAPILFPYVWWLLQRSKERGIKRLYFVARDGYVLKQMADLMIAAQKLKIETAYLYGSRQAWRTALPEFAPQVVQKWDGDLTVDGFADALGIPRREFRKILPGKDSMSKEEMLGLIRQNPEIKSLVAQVQQKNQELAKAYLSQEIRQSKPFAFVDLYGNGFTMDCLARLMGQKISVFYLGLAGKARSKHLEKYCFGMLKNTCQIEKLCRAPHGPTLGYQKKG
jgi:predicted HAD superfamily hydrolase